MFTLTRAAAQQIQQAAAASAAQDQALRIAARQAAVGRETFVYGKPRHQVIEVLFEIGGDEAATGSPALAPRHVKNIHHAHHLYKDFLN